jgi:hypothetical protein
MHRSLGVAVLLTLGACGGSPAMAPPTSSEAEAAVPAPTSVAKPAAITSLASVIPADAIAYVTVPGTKRLSDVAARIVVGFDLLDVVGQAIESETGLSRRTVTGFLRELDGVALAVSGDKAPLLVMKTDDAAAVSRLLADDTIFTPGTTANRFTFARADGKVAGFEIRHDADRGVLAVGPVAMLERSAKALDDGSSLATAPRFVAAQSRFSTSPSVDLYLDLPAMLQGEQAPVTAHSALRLSLAMGEGVVLDADVVLDAPNAPPKAIYARPSEAALPGRLSGDTVAFLSYATRFGDVDKGRLLWGGIESLDAGAALALEVAARTFGIDPEGLLGALADEGVVGVVMPPADKLRRDAGVWGGALVELRQQIADRSAVAAMLSKAKNALAASTRVTVASLRDGLVVASKGDPIAVAVALRGDELVLVAGEASAAKAAIDAGGRRLGEDSAFLATRARLADHQLGLWFDVARTLDALSRELEDDELAVLARSASASRSVGTMAFGYQPADEGWRLQLRMHDAAALGVVAAFATRGVRRYLVAAKSSEARNTVAAIARGAAASYEREGIDGAHRFCSSAPSVPAGVPSGRKYQPNSADGQDFRSGDASTGWRCLKFELTTPHYYQYSYRQGGDYLGPARGGPDPGPFGFEAAAVGDLDGDGVTSLFTRTGRIDPRTGNVVLSPELFVADERE